MCEDGGVVGIPEHEGEMYTADPIIRWFSICKALFEVEGSAFDIITSWEHEDAPGAGQHKQFSFYLSKYSHQGCPPASNTGPCSLLGKVRQFSICQVCVASAMIGGFSSVGWKMSSFIASTAEKSAKQPGQCGAGWAHNHQHEVSLADLHHCRAGLD